jgi:hypothetical protein
MKIVRIVTIARDGLVVLYFLVINFMAERMIVGFIFAGRGASEGF